MEKYTALGQMSGTSVDGMDLCLAEFRREEKRWHYSIIAAQTYEYPKNWEARLKNAPQLPAEDLLALHTEYGFYIGEKIREFLIDNHLKNPDLIASHGHTVFHQPERKFTFQIGDGRAIKNCTGITTVYDFRSQDVILGGNGAPLVPMGDLLLFPEYDACLNLGGFSNISFDDGGGRRIAFDICPVNTVLNHFSEQLGKPYDDGGRLAASGNIDGNLLAELDGLPYYRQPFPKSLGSEQLWSDFLPLLSGYDATTVLATFTEHAAVQIARSLDEFQLKNVLLSGGGALNSFLVEKIRGKTTAKAVLPDSPVIHFKEALIFGFLGLLRFLNEENVLATATGASRNHSSGIVV